MKLYYEQELSYETGISRLQEERGFNNNTALSISTAPMLSQVAHTKTIPDDSTDYRKESVISQAKSIATDRHENSILVDQITRTKSSMTLTTPRTEKVIVTDEDLQLAKFVGDQRTKSYKLQTLSNSLETQKRNQTRPASSIRKTLVWPLVSMGFLIALAGGVFWSVKNIETLTRFSHQKFFNRLPLIDNEKSQTPVSVRNKQIPALQNRSTASVKTPPSVQIKTKKPVICYFSNHSCFCSNKAFRRFSVCQ